MRRALLIACLIALAGCTVSKLETGYEPDKLGATAGQRRAYYAPPFSPEATPDDLGPDGGAGPQGPPGRR